MDVSKRPVARLAFVAVATLLTSACSLQAPTFGQMGGGQGESFRVSYLVRCRACRVFYTAGRERESVEVTGSWSKTVRIRDANTRVVQLMAAPNGNPGYIEHAYIEVDGEIVAEDRRNSSGGMHTDVALTAPLVKKR